MEEKGAGERKTINAVDTSFRILEALADLRGAGVTELANHLGVTKGTVYNHLATLKRRDYVTKDVDDRYHLGLRFLDLAHHSKARFEVHSLAKSEVDALAEESGELALFTVEEHGKGICVYRAYGEKAVRTDLYEGARSGLHHTAVGKAILAHLPSERVEAILADELTVETPNTITDAETLRAELDAIRERGLAFNRGETISGLVGVGAPIVDPSGGVAGAISVIGPAKRLDEEYLQGELADLLTRSANIVEINATSI